MVVLLLDTLDTRTRRGTRRAEFLQTKEVQNHGALLLSLETINE